MRKTMRKALMPLLAAACLAILLVSCGPKDADIQASVDTALRANPDLSTVSASVKDRVVTLSGETKDETYKARAEELVKGVKGVKNVINNTTVAPPPPAPAPITIQQDDPLTKAVTDAIKDYDTVTAEVKDGVIILTGTIRRSQLPKLMQTLNTLKPKKIENKLTIK